MIKKIFAYTGLVGVLGGMMLIKAPGVMAAGVDAVPPTDPQNLVVLYGGDNYARLQWEASADSFDPSGIKYNIFVNGTQTATATSIPFNVPGLSPHTAYAFQVSASDAAGNTSNKSNIANYTTEPDTVKPFVQITYPADWASMSGNVTFTATSTDDVGLAGVQFVVDGQLYGDPLTATPYTLTVNANNFTKGSTHRLSAQATDTSGNMAVSSAINFTVGQAYAPVAVGIQVGQITNNSAQVTWQSGLNTTGTVKYGLTTSYDNQVSDPSLSTSHQAGLNNLQTGKTYHFIIESALSGYANSTTTDQTFTTTESPGLNDTTTPAVLITFPQNGSQVSGNTTVMVNATDPDVSLQLKSGIAKVWLTVDGQTAGNEVYAPPYNIIWNTTTAAKGSHALKAFASDNAGNTASTTINVMVEDTVPTTPAPSGTGAHPNGALILDGTTVFLIRNGKRVSFRDPEEYKSYGYNFAQVVPASSEDKQLPLAGDPLKALAGTLVLDKADNKTVFMMGENGSKRGFASQAVFYGLGYNFKNLFKINLNDYTAGPVINSAKEPHPEGALVKSGSALFWITAGHKNVFPSAVVFGSFGFNSSRVVNANSADTALPTGETIRFRDGTLIKQGSDYYVISDGKKLKFSSAEQLAAKGYKASIAVSANIDAYESGENVQ